MLWKTFSSVWLEPENAIKTPPSPHSPKISIHNSKITTQTPSKTHTDQNLNQRSTSQIQPIGHPKITMNMTN
jgi:hypothetical protein